MSEQNPIKGAGDTGAMDGSEAPSSLGASASLPAGSKRRRRGGDEGSGGPGLASRLRPRVGPGKGAVLVLVAILLLAAVPLVGSAMKKTPRDKVGISYGGGPIEGSRFQKIVQPGSSLFFNGLFDPLYLYPADQQNYIVSKAATEGDKATADSVVAPSSDRVQVSYQLAVYYKLNTDELRSFHEEFGLKYQAYTGSGWKKLIEDTFRQQIENALQEETRRYSVAQIYGDAELLLTIQESVQQTLSERLNRAMGSDFFCAPGYRPGGECEAPTFVIKKVDLPESVVAAFEDVRTSDIAVETEKNRVAQREQEALGIAALQEAWGDDGSVYAIIKAIEEGLVKFWVLPSDGGITVGTPDGAAGDAPAEPGTPAGDGG